MQRACLRSAPWPRRSSRPSSYPVQIRRTEKPSRDRTCRRFCATSQARSAWLTPFRTMLQDRLRSSSAVRPIRGSISPLAMTSRWPSPGARDNVRACQTSDDQRARRSGHTPRHRTPGSLGSSPRLKTEEEQYGQPAVSRGQSCSHCGNVFGRFTGRSCARAHQWGEFGLHALAQGFVVGWRPILRPFLPVGVRLRPFLRRPWDLSDRRPFREPAQIGRADAALVGFERIGFQRLSCGLWRSEMFEIDPQNFERHGTLVRVRDGQVGWAHQPVQGFRSSPGSESIFGAARKQEES